jgi:SAM-dependent methyltransferase
MTALLYRLLYRLGITPWEDMASLPIAGQIEALFAAEEEQGDPPYGAALDLGCGTGIWTVQLARRGWSVTGIDLVPHALRRARKRASEAGVTVRLVRGDVTRHLEPQVGFGFDLVLDFGLVHGLGTRQRAAIGSSVTDTAAPGATLLMLAFEPAHRGPLPRGMSRREIEAIYPAWTIDLDEPQDLTGAPRVVRRARPRWYRLRKR